MTPAGGDTDSVLVSTVPITCAVVVLAAGAAAITTTMGLRALRRCIGIPVDGSAAKMTDAIACAHQLVQRVATAGARGAGPPAVSAEELLRHAQRTHRRVLAELERAAHSRRPDRMRHHHDRAGEAAATLIETAIRMERELDDPSHS